MNALAALPSADVLLELTDIFAGNHVRNSDRCDLESGLRSMGMGFVSADGRAMRKSQCLSKVAVSFNRALDS